MDKIKDYFQLVESLKTQNLTIATAESCTGGLIAKLITDVPGSSQVFVGGVVSYSNEMKMKWLGVNHKTLERYGAVSTETVEEMLNGILRETDADLAVAVSGIAGPGGGTKDKPVGMVYLGVGFRNKRLIEKFVFQGSREDVREKSARKIIEMIHRLLSVN